MTNILIYLGVIYLIFGKLNMTILEDCIKNEDNLKNEEDDEIEDNY